VQNAEDLTPENLIRYIEWRIESYNTVNYRNDDMWECFRVDYEGWTKETFDALDHDLKSRLRDAVRERGVYVKKGNKAGPISNALHYVLVEEEPHCWTPEEIRYQENNGGFKVKLTNVAELDNSQQNPLHSTPMQTALVQDHTITGALLQQTTPSLTTPSSTQNPQPLLNPQPPFNPQPPLNQLQPSTSYQTGHVSPIQPQLIGSQSLANLIKGYSDDMKYGGGEDSFDLKLRIFEDMCLKTGVIPDQYHLAFSTMLRKSANEFYYDNLVGKGHTYIELQSQIRNHFETEERRQEMLSKWNTTTLINAIRNNPEKGAIECFEIMLNNLRTIQRGLAKEYHTEGTLRDRIINACRDVPECQFACYKPSSSLEGFCADLRMSITTMTRGKGESTTYLTDDQLYTDRQYHGGSRFQQNRRGRPPSRNTSYGQGSRQQDNRAKRCFVCKKEGCWSTKHSKEERDKAYDIFRKRLYEYKKPYSDKVMRQYIAEFEGIPEEDEGTDDYEVFIMDWEFSDQEEEHEEEHVDQPTQYLTSMGQVEGFKTITLLNDQSVKHALTRLDSAVFTVENRYSSHIFKGIIPDTGAAEVSTAGHNQYEALKKIQDVKLNRKRAGEANIRFGIGTSTSIGTVDVSTPIGIITFHVLDADTPFLLCLGDMDKLDVKFDNLENLLIQGGRKVPVVRKWGHPWMLLDFESAMACNFMDERNIIGCHLTGNELRQLHRRFGHPSARRLLRVLQRSGHEVNSKAIQQLTKCCHQCQIHGKSPSRFKFTIRDDCNFNHTVYIDVVYIDGQPALHVVDEATRFGAARWVKSMSAQHAWDALRACWIDVYIGPPDIIAHDAGKNFASEEFRQHAATMAITTKGVPVEAHQSIGIVERYHAPLRRAYNVLREELKNARIDKDIMLQMAVKAVNDTAGPNGLIPTLLVFGAYPRMTTLDPPAPSITQRAAAIKSAMREVRKCHAERQVADALRMRNGPNTRNVLDLPINSDVLVWREKDGWNGPYKLLSTEGETCTISMPSGPVQFRSTVVKPYYTREEEVDDIEQEEITETTETLTPSQTQSPRPRGRPKGAKNKPKDVATIRRNPDREAKEHDHFVTAFMNQDDIDEAFLTNKEMLDRELSKKLREQGLITTPGQPFEESRRQEIDGLMAKGVFELIPYDPDTMNGVRLFNSRLVDEVKGKATSTPYEKSRLVVQAYNDEGKKEILTQSPTIQRLSQRIILALAPALARKVKLCLRDITQAYVQSTTPVNRLIIARPPKEIATSLPPNTVMKIMKPLYGLPEAGTHWFGTYYRHHCEKLKMIPSTYDSCLLVTATNDAFGLVGMQTDDTLFLGDEAFMTRENEELNKANLLAKPVEILSTEKPLIFNGCKLFQDHDGITLKQNNQGNRIELIDIKSETYQQSYIEQRARGAYIATICQPEATFDLSTAAQTQNPAEKEVKELNKRLEWQKNNRERGIHYVAIDLETTKVFTFVDASFANNKDLSSQIGYVLVLANEREVGTDKKEILLRGNIIHWSSTKCRRITRSVLASELYAMTQGIDTTFSINTTLTVIMKQLGFEKLPIIICTDSYSLYECMVKLGSTKEKRLMIDLMAMRQSYERRELSEIRWINGKDNPADAMTKSIPNKALQSLIDTNELQIRVEGWVQRMDAV